MGRADIIFVQNLQHTGSRHPGNQLRITQAQGKRRQDKIKYFGNGSSPWLNCMYAWTCEMESCMANAYTSKKPSQTGRESPRIVKIMTPPSIHVPAFQAARVPNGIAHCEYCECQDGLEPPRDEPRPRRSREHGGPRSPCDNWLSQTANWLIADFPGRFGWGYEGVNLFAPTRLHSV
jgi:hypothetical protein